LNAGSDKEKPVEKKITIKILSKTEDDRLKLSEMTLVDTKTLYKRIMQERKDQK